VTRRRSLAFASGLAALAAVGALWLYAAPTGLGGRLDYAVIVGSSMQPTVHRGDLAVLHRRSSYRVGDVVGYRSADLHRVVLHRIVGVVDGRYVFKGDNNSFVDSYRPTPDQLVGGLWVRVPAVGSLFTWTRAPRHALLLGILAAFVLAGGGAEARRRREPREGPSGPSVRPRTAWAAAGGLAAAALAFGAVGLLGLGHGRTRVAELGQAYRESGSYTYAGAATQGTVYPDGRVSTGRTVFTRLVHELRVSFDYRFSSALVHRIGGTVALEGRLTSQQGFTRELSFGPATPLRGDHAVVSGSLDLDALQRAVSAYQRSTGVLSDSYTVSVTPHVALHGAVAGVPLATSFVPTPLSFALDLTKLKVLVPDQIGAAAGAPAPDPLHVFASGSIPQVVPGSVALWRLRLPVQGARRLGLGGAAALGLAALLAALYGLRRRTAGEGDPAEQILRRYKSWIVPVASPLEAPRTVDVAGIDSLCRLGEHYGRAILHEERDGVHTFAIEEGGTLYRFRIGAEPPPIPIELRSVEPRAAA
jgi:signal peptidase I